MIKRQDVMKLCQILDFDIKDGIGHDSTSYAVCLFPLPSHGKVLCHIDQNGNLISRPNLINFVEKEEPTIDDLLKFIIKSLEILDFSGHEIHVAVKKELTKRYRKALKRGS